MFDREVISSTRLIGSAKYREYYHFLEINGLNHHLSRQLILFKLYRLSNRNALSLKSNFLIVLDSSLERTRDILHL